MSSSPPSPPYLESSLLLTPLSQSISPDSNKELNIQKQLGLIPTKYDDYPLHQITSIRTPKNPKLADSIKKSQEFLGKEYIGGRKRKSHKKRKTHKHKKSHRSRSKRRHLI